MLVLFINKRGNMLNYNRRRLNDRLWRADLRHLNLFFWCWASLSGLTVVLFLHLFITFANHLLTDPFVHPDVFTELVDIRHEDPALLPLLSFVYLFGLLWNNKWCLRVLNNITSSLAILNIIHERCFLALQ